MNNPTRHTIRNHPPARSLALLLALLLACTAWLPVAMAGTGASREVILITGPETADLLESVAGPLLRVAGMAPDSVTFHLMLDAKLNAFALPGQHIVLHSGLLLALRGRDELAGVLAHELAHLTAGHHIQLADEVRNISISTLISALAGLAVTAATGSGQMGQATMMGGMAGSRADMLDSIRQKETQADRLALRYLADAGYDPAGLADFLRRIEQEQRLTQLPPPYLMTHPLSSQRVMEAGQAAREMPRRTPLPDREGFALQRVQAKLKAGTTQDPATAAAEFRARLAKDPTDFAARYGLAAAQRYGGQLADAEENLTQLLKSRARDPYLLRERGLVRLEGGRMDGAEADLRQALADRPESDDLEYWLAFVLKERGKEADAMRILRRLTLKHPREARYFYLLGLVEGKLGHLETSHLALGHHHRLIREDDTARWHYQEAVRLSPPDSPGHRQAKSGLKELAERR